MKKRKSSKSSKPSNRIPPSIPKCVRRCIGGYCTDYIAVKALNAVAIMFMFRKNANGYSILYKHNDETKWRVAAADMSLSPTTRAALGDQPTLTAAINALQKWLGYELPDIR